MRLRFLGHATVLVETDDGFELLVDPYEPGGFDGRMNYPPLTCRPDAVVYTHDHADHSAVDCVPGRPEVVEGDGRAGPFTIRRYPFAHDEYEGRRFGGSVDALALEADGRRIVHGADIGQSPSGPLPGGLRGADLAFLPVGGLYTVGPAQAREWTRRLAARLTVPIHYKTPACELPLGGLESFLAHFPDRHITRLPGDDPVIELGAALRNFDSRVVVV